jgi:hypothetical protein
MLALQQQRQASNKAANRALLERQQRPFSFYAADSLRAKRKLEEAAREEGGSPLDEGGRVRFRASPVPASTHEVGFKTNPRISWSKDLGFKGPNNVKGQKKNK